MLMYSFQRDAVEHTGVFLDSGGRLCRAWRPTMAPPPPQLSLQQPAWSTAPTHRAPPAPTAEMDSDTYLTLSRQRNDVDSCIGNVGDSSTASPHRTAPAPTAESPEKLRLAQKLTASPPASATTDSRRIAQSVTTSTTAVRGPLCRQPPHGQLLPRGSDGLDGLLRLAREAQTLRLSLQARRQREEAKSAQVELATALDRQREYKRMVDLAAYQEDLVNIFGPSMRNVLADTFFDDGTDPALRLLSDERTRAEQVAAAARNASPQLRPEKAWQRARESHLRRAQARVTMRRDPLYADTCETSTSALEDRFDVPPRMQQGWVLGSPSATREREALLSALERRRDNRRRPY